MFLVSSEKVAHNIDTIAAEREGHKECRPCQSFSTLGFALLILDTDYQVSFSPPVSA